MDFFDSLGRFDNIHQRGVQGTHPSVRYPSPFFDIANSYMPITVKHMFRWCSYYFLTNPIINPIVTNLSEYPITDILVNETSDKVREKWESIINDQLDIRSFLIEVGLDYFTYGNAFISIHFPFQKYLICSVCGHKDKIENCNYKFRSLKYRLTCKQCDSQEDAKVKDENIKSIKGIRLIRWNPENIDIEHVHQIGQTDYFLSIPLSDRNDILLGKKHVVERLPNIFIEAVRAQKRIKFTDGEIYHFRRHIISQKDFGWGMPLILPALKSAYHVQILRKAQEAVMHGCIVPLRIIFPQGGDSQSSPYLNVNLANWSRNMQRELEKWRLDPNYIPIMPLPLGNEIIGGEGKSLTLYQELEIVAKEIANAMGVPLEFYMGGLSWSGSNISLKFLENKFLSYRQRQLGLCRDFILGRIADYMGWVRPSISFKSFKMADDLQRSALLFQLNQQQKISDESLLDSLDYDVNKEDEKKNKESIRQIATQRKLQKAQVNMQGEAAVIQAKYQAMAQKKMTEMGMAGATGQPGQEQQGQPGQAPGGGQADGQEAAQQVPGMPEGASVSVENAQPAPGAQSPLNMQTQGGLDLNYLAGSAKNALEGMDPMTKQLEMMNMKGANPDLFRSVVQMMNSTKGSQTNPLDPLTMPSPKIKPPRRGQ